MTSLKDKHCQAVSTLLDRITPEVDTLEAANIADALATLCDTDVVDFCRRNENPKLPPSPPPPEGEPRG